MTQVRIYENQTCLSIIMVLRYKEWAVPQGETQRLTINLPAQVLVELRALAESSHRSMAELVRDAFALAKIAYEEGEKGNSLAVMDRNGRVVKELVMPR